MTWGAPDWTSEDTAALRDMWANGKSAREIGLELNRSKNSVIGRAHRMGLDARKSPIRPRNPDAPAPVRLPVFTLPTLPSLRKPAYNALPPPSPEKRALVVQLLTGGRSNVGTAGDVGLTIDEVRKIRGTIDVPKRVRVSDSTPAVRIRHDKAGKEMPKVFEGVDFMTSERRAEIWRPRVGQRFVFGKALDRKKLTGNIPTAADIAAFIATRGVTQCPTVAVAETTATIGAEDRAAVAAHYQAIEGSRVTIATIFASRGGIAAKRAAAMRR